MTIERGGLHKGWPKEPEEAEDPCADGSHCCCECEICCDCGQPKPPLHKHDFKPTNEHIGMCVIMRCECGEEVESDVS